MVLKVVELFAGVGGFRIGFEGPPDSENSTNAVIWSNQWEPGKKVQDASDIYVEKWNMTPRPSYEHEYVGEKGDIHVNKDISTIDVKDIPDHDLLCGGFPCQDYSVAKTLDKAKGLEGKKGVLWWEIHRIIKAKKPSIVLLENVDRLTKSPSTQRGRDFAVMLASLDELDYAVEWRVIDASSYGFPQRRKRVFILAYLKGTEHYQKLVASNPMEYLAATGIFAKAFPIKPPGVLVIPEFDLGWQGEWDRLAKITDNFNKDGKKNYMPFKIAGTMVDGKVRTCKIIPDYQGEKQTLGEILLSASEIPDEFVLDANDLLRDKGWIYQKGGKKEERKAPSGHVYNYAEGPVTFPDDLSKPSRTIITGEGGRGASRFKHVVVFQPEKAMIKRLNLSAKDCNKVRKKLELEKNQWLRRLTPVELERLNGFPDNHTEGVSDGKRAFLMGNALVIGIVDIIGFNLN